MSDSDENRRIFEYFVVAGLGEEPKELTPGAQECGAKNASPQAPVTDVCVIFPSLGEQVPEGFTCIETTPSGYPADLNHGSLRTASCYLCFRRGYHKPPLVDIGVLYENKGERVMVDSQILQTTPFGRPANVNNASQGIYLTYRRAQDNAPPNLLAVTDICVILTNKGEQAPHTFCKVAKNLNKGMVGSDVFICYKKSQANANRIAYKPEILDRFPIEDEQVISYSNPNDVLFESGPCYAANCYKKGYPLTSNVPLFCLPMGAVIECWPAKCHDPARLFSTFVLTNDKGKKLYGAAVTFYERFESDLSPEQLERLGLGQESQTKSGSVSDNSSTNDPAEQMTFHHNKAICVVGKYPFFTAFKRFLFYIHRMSFAGTYSLPIERYISHLMYEVPFPTARRPRVLVQLGNETITFDSHDDSQLPLSGAAYIDFLKNLGAENCMYLVMLALLEKKILLHSLRPWLLTSVSEAMCSLIFPFHWQCPYIPQCPLEVAGVLHAPLPFIAGVDSRYFELYDDPPLDVTCIDLDTQTISQSDIRKTVKLSFLPRRPAKLLKQTLEHLYRKVQQEDFNVTVMRRSTDFVPIDIDYQILKRRKTLELEIQEAFLRLIASIMKGYTAFLKPIRSAPKVGSTDTGALFDLESFLRTRDRSGSEFYKRFHDTQCFIRFIEERSLESDKNTYHAFFDECIGKVDPSATSLDAEQKLLEYESALNSEHTVFIAPPESFTADEDSCYSYNGFPKFLEIERFQLDNLVAAPVKLLRTPARSKVSMTGHTPAGRRTKYEAKSAQKLARQQASSPLTWAKCVLSYAYSLWFIHLPAYLAQSNSKQRALRLGLAILDRMERAQLPVLDEVCYRILIELSGECGKPLMAVKVYMAMSNRNLSPNAITYGIYHRAVLEAKWPSLNAQQAEKRWTKLRHAVRAIALFKQAQSRKSATRSKRTLSQFSGESGNLEGAQSMTSLNSQGVKFPDQISLNTVQSYEKAETISEFESDTKPAPSDAGYHSQTTVDSFASGKTMEEETVKLRSIAASDLEIFEQFQAKKKRSIVDPKRNSSLSSRQSLGSYDSPAGLLMTSGERTSILDDSVFEPAVSEPKLSLDRKSSRPTSFEPEKLAEDLHLLTDTDTSLYDATSLSGIPEERMIESPGLMMAREFSKSPSRSIRTEVTENDPLGVLSVETEPVQSIAPSDKEPLLSPQRRVMLDDEQRLFEGEEFESHETSTPTSEASYWTRATGMKSWLNKVGSASVNKMIKSQTIGEHMNSSLNELTNSPSLNSIVNQASKFKTRMGDMVSQPNIARLRMGANSMMKEIRSFKGNLDTIGSPLRGSLSSLNTNEIMQGDINRYDDNVSLVEEDSAWIIRNEALGGELPDEDPAFQLSSGEPGTILFNPQNTGDETGQLIEVLLCTCTKCPHCSNLLYDEEIIAGWKAEESNLNSVCQFCFKTFVPVLTVTVKHNAEEQSTGRTRAQSWYNIDARSTAKRRDLGRVAAGGSVESLSSLPDTPLKQSSPPCRSSLSRQLFPPQSPSVPECSHTVPYLSPLVLRREMENVLSSDQQALTKPAFMEAHPILYWNLLYSFQRLCVPTHLISWIAAGQEPKPKLLVRCVYDQPKIHQEELSRPLYLAALEPTAHSSELVSALVLEQRTLNQNVLDQIVHCMNIPHIIKAIQLLINEHRKTAPLGAGAVLGQHSSMYRDLLFLALVKFGKQINRDSFDREYANAFGNLQFRVQAVLPPPDHPPKKTVRACRKIFMPLDVC